jgi:hypothetical protein
VDLDRDCVVNFYEFTVLSENWPQTRKSANGTIFIR